MGFEPMTLSGGPGSLPLFSTVEVLKKSKFKIYKVVCVRGGLYCSNYGETTTPKSGTYSYF